MKQISAKIIQDSINQSGKRIVTFELEYPRFIHSELMTHRVFSRNAASSRAIPIKTMNDNIMYNPAMPVEWGTNNPGMQSKQLASAEQKESAILTWLGAKEAAITYSNGMAELGIHKQIVNRITEPYQRMKTVVTSTEWDNWFELRNHSDAQPEIHALAEAMADEMFRSHPFLLKGDEWHLPYINRNFSTGSCQYFIDDERVSLPDAKMLSVSCCAQVSYRKSDLSKEKALAIYDKLVGMTPFHASPFEHQATPIPDVLVTLEEAASNRFIKPSSWPDGVTHMNKYGNLGSGNFYGWIQLRQLM